MGPTFSIFIFVNLFFVGFNYKYLDKCKSESIKISKFEQMESPLDADFIDSNLHKYVCTLCNKFLKCFFKRYMV